VFAVVVGVSVKEAVLAVPELSAVTSTEVDAPEIKVPW
jgi:hypothetical protein